VSVGLGMEEGDRLRNQGFLKTLAVYGSKGGVWESVILERRVNQRFFGNNS